MFNNDSFLSNWLPVAIVLSVLIVAFAFGPNCESASDESITQCTPTSPTEADTESMDDVDAHPYCETVKYQRWAHTRVADCRRVTGDKFTRCMWWVFGDDRPRYYDVEPDKDDGPRGYQGKPPPDDRN